MASRKVDVVVARALHHALEPTFDTSRVTTELFEVAEGSWPVVMAALLRVDHALQERWSEVGAAAADALRLTLARIEEREGVAA